MTENWTPDSPPIDPADEQPGAATPAAAEPADIPTDLVFEDLSLGQALAYLFWRPAETARLFWQVLTYEGAGEVETGTHTLPDGDGDGEPGGGTTRARVKVREEAADLGAFELAPRREAARDDLAAAPAVTPARRGARDQARAWWLAAGVLLAAVLLALRGGTVLQHAALDPALHMTGNADGAFLWLVAAGALYVGYAIFQGRGWWQARLPRIAGWLHDRVHTSAQPVAWNAGLALAMVVALWLAVIAASSGWIALVPLALAGALWIALVLANAPAPDAVAPLAPGDRPGAENGGEDAFVVRSVVVESAPRPSGRTVTWLSDHLARLVLVPVALLLSAAAYSANVQRDTLDQVVDVVFTPVGFAAWIGSIALWVVILAVDVRTLPERWDAFDGAAALRRLAGSLRPTWTGLALLAIMAVGAVFRLHDLDATPPEMTSDHIEKLLDALRVSEGLSRRLLPQQRRARRLPDGPGGGHRGLVRRRVQLQGAQAGDRDRGPGHAAVAVVDGAPDHRQRHRARSPAWGTGSGWSWPGWWRSARGTSCCRGWACASC